jgi:hypothetical protein
MGASGNLVGTRGVRGDCCLYQGTILNCLPAGTETVLFDFTKKTGDLPVSGLIEDSTGNPYGTTAFFRKKQSGVVFKLTQ